MDAMASLTITNVAPQKKVPIMSRIVAIGNPGHAPG